MGVPRIDTRQKLSTLSIFDLDLSFSTGKTKVFHLRFDSFGVDVQLFFF